jgi:hypothetical protein
MKNIFVIFGLLGAVFCLMSCASTVRVLNSQEIITEEAVKENLVENTMTETVKITGRVVIFGSEPHTYAGIITEDGTHYSIYPLETEKELWGLQAHLIEFNVIVLPEPKGYGSVFLGNTVTPVSWEIIR